jgi:hypothetical protein
MTGPADEELEEAEEAAILAIVAALPGAGYFGTINGCVELAVVGLALLADDRDFWTEVATDAESTGSQASRLATIRARALLATGHGTAST